MGNWLNEYRHTLPAEAEDVYAAANPGSLMRSTALVRSGLFRLSRRTCSLYSVEIKAGGSWGRLICFDAQGNLRLFQPSTFTGSFVIEACCWDGLYVLSDCGIGTSDPLLTINWREPDTKIV